MVSEFLSNLIYFSIKYIKWQAETVSISNFFKFFSYSCTPFPEQTISSAPIFAFPHRRGDSRIARLYHISPHRRDRHPRPSTRSLPSFRANAMNLATFNHSTFINLYPFHNQILHFVQNDTLHHTHRRGDSRIARLIPSTTHGPHCISRRFTAISLCTAKYHAIHRIASHPL